MNTKLNILRSNALAAICFVASGCLAFFGKDGWGWFLFIGLLCVRKD